MGDIESAGELQARLEQVERENEELRGRLKGQPMGAVTVKPVAKKRGRSVFAVILIVIGAILAPVATVGARANTLLTDTDQFVATFGPLAKDPAVQKLVTDETVTLIKEQVDIPALTGSLIDGIADLGAPPRAVAAAKALKGPLNAGLSSLVDTTVSNVVSSDAFASTWDEALRLTHSQLLKTLQGDQNAALAIAGDGSLNLQLAPVLESLKKALVAQGIDFAAQIPAVDMQIPIAKDVSLTSVQLSYGVATALGQWLQWVSLGLLALGVLVAPRRRRALMGAATALAITTALLLIGFAVARSVLPIVTPLPNDAVEAVFAAVTDPIVHTAMAVITVAVLLVIVGWCTGPANLPTRLRALFGAGTARLREISDRYGVDTGAFGFWCERWHRVLRVIVAVGAGTLVLLIRPLTTGLVVWTLVGALVLLLLSDLLRRPNTAEPENDLEAGADITA
ncbi:hypothetical protein G7066_05725 [Leucobacter coleopterorum]|uniref:Integral membrane protein n=1 Tax=Leucobacter coleopterorum TaxID=2714933 RepID=A0ABX6JZS8_9MICO|nr:hypothetical protein [Leucobacter coleopterorum]QIM18275.1 hypothetical protein G7066_05725 [Leucobacter coleopterorum]